VTEPTLRRASLPKSRAAEGPGRVKGALYTGKDSLLSTLMPLEDIAPQDDANPISVLIEWAETYVKKRDGVILGSTSAGARVEFTGWTKGHPGWSANRTFTPGSITVNEVMSALNGLTAETHIALSGPHPLFPSHPHADPNLYSQVSGGRSSVYNSSFTIGGSGTSSLPPADIAWSVVTCQPGKNQETVDWPTWLRIPLRPPKRGAARAHAGFSLLGSPEIEPPTDERLATVLSRDR